MSGGIIELTNPEIWIKDFGDSYGVCVGSEKSSMTFSCFYETSKFYNLIQLFYDNLKTVRDTLNVDSNY